MDELTKVAGGLKAVWENDLKPRISNIEKAVDDVQDRMDSLDVRGQKAGLAGSGSKAVEGRGPLLTLEQKIAPHFKQEEPEGEDFDAKQVRLGALIVGALHYDAVKSQLNEHEKKALGILTDPSGGMLLPTTIGHLWLDAIRPKLRVLQAGALSYAMEAHNVLLPGWDNIPQAGWRAGGQFADAGGSFRLLELNAHDCGCFIDIPNVLFEDAADNLAAVSDLVETQLSKAIAQSLDLAALLSRDALTTDGSNATGIPSGLAKLDSTSVLTTNYGIPLATSSGTNGNSPTWDWYIDAVAAIAAANFTATGHLTAPRALSSLAKLKLTTNDYLRKPPYLAGVTDYDTSQIPLTLKKGTSTNCTASFVGDFTRMVLGLRGDVAMLRDPYTQGRGRVTRLIVWQKADVGILNKSAFQVIDGVTP